MAHPVLDPQFEAYLAEKPSLTYVQQNDGRLKRLFIDRLEIALGRRKMEEVYHALKEQEFKIQSFFSCGLSAANIKVLHTGVDPASITVAGPLVFLANHPFGIVDGMVLCDIAAQTRGDLRILINALLCQDRDLAPYFLPIDFAESRAAVKTNIRSKQLALQALADDVPVLIFPSGMVSTAGKFGFGKVLDGPWTTFAAKLVRESKATVIPVYFHGRNSRKFHVASHIAEPLRMGMLVHEALNKFGNEVGVAVGEPIPWLEIEHHHSRKELTELLYKRVQDLATTQY